MSLLSILLWQNYHNTHEKSSVFGHLEAIHMEMLLCVNARFASFWLICILCISTTPSPHPSTSSLQSLNPATSLNNNNNNGWLHACVRAAEDIEPNRVTRAKCNAPLPLRWAKKDYGQPTSSSCCVWFLLLLSVCILCASIMGYPSLLLRFWWILSTTYRPGIWTTACWVVYYGSVWSQMYLKQC